MKVIKSPNQLTRLILKLKKKKKRIGFVPTMGSLHEGHLSLVRFAAKETSVVVASIFVNPTQFGPKEDFKRYPRNLVSDLKFLRREKVDFVFLPTASSIYPKRFNAFLNPGPLAKTLCGPKRPGHFRGVVTVMKRLFDITLPDIAYFGAKDYQQARIIQEMVKRLHLSIQVKTCPIVREKDGLAMSSRNVYLSLEERLQARAISRVLQFAKSFIRKVHLSPHTIEQNIISLLKPYVDKIDYVSLVDAVSLRKPKRLKGKLLLAIACFIGKTRLIDNVVIQR
ncbi:MAG: pantoate--beta-alanine ligase [Candidatus Omnitrophica bacterium]|nr:pantoate--beta-alanine ligase [Candidatus Omnitrophota bacterium]